MKILIVKIAAIGDVVMALPLLTYIRTHFPQSHVTWICGSQVKPLIEAAGLVDEILSVDEKKLLKGSFLARLSELLKTWSQIAGRAFDLCLTAHPDPRYRWVSFPIRCKTRRSWTRQRGRLNPVPGRYHAEEYLRLLTHEENISETQVVFPKLSIHLKKSTQDLFAKFDDKPLVVLAPGGAKNVLADDALRRWPIASYASFMKSLSEHPVHLIVVGSESDRWVAEHFERIPYADLIGKLELLELVALFQLSKLLVTHDSGPLHLAKLADCPTIGLFGPTNPSEKIGSQEKIKVLWGGEKLACRPCYDGKTYAACRRNVCLASITPSVVLNEALQLLQMNEKFDRSKK